MPKTKSGIRIAGWDANTLPDEIRKELRLGYKGNTTLQKRVMDILGNAPQTGYSINEIIVLYYQTHNEVLKRQNLQSMMGSLIKKEQAVRIAPGFYAPKDRK